MMKNPYKPTVHYLSNTRWQTDEFRGWLVNIGKPRAQMNIHYLPGIHTRLIKSITVRSISLYLKPVSVETFLSWLTGSDAVSKDWFSREVVELP